MVMGSPPDEVLDTTIAFLRSRNGVRQAMYVPFLSLFCLTVLD